jgi:hypothetical protein
MDRDGFWATKVAEQRKLLLFFGIRFFGAVAGDAAAADGVCDGWTRKGFFIGVIWTWTCQWMA